MIQEACKARSRAVSAWLIDVLTAVRKFRNCAALIVLSACGGGGGDSDSSNSTPPPNLAGVWAGTWTGSNSVQGLVTGTWEAELSQTIFDGVDGQCFETVTNPGWGACSKTGVTGTATLRGDIDCMDGVISGAVDAFNSTRARESGGPTISHQVIGRLDRPPCNTNNWQLTALNLDNHSASGIWNQFASGGSGTLTGTQIAKPGGPRISYFSPPSGITGALVTITGTNFGPLVPDNSLLFEARSADTLTASTTMLTTRAPDGATTGPVFLTTPLGTAISPVAFVRDVTYPTPFSTATITTGAGSESVAISPDGRKAYVANNAAGTVSLVNTANNSVIASTSPGGAPRSLAVSPDGRWVYLTSGDSAISVLDAATTEKVDRIPIIVGGVPLALGGGTELTPHGMAVSPDSRYLYALQNVDGGAVVVVDIAAKTAVTGISAGVGTMPVGVAVHPDGQHAYFAFAGSGIKVFSKEGMMVTGAVGSGSHPSAMLVTPDGAKLYVANKLSNSVDVFDAISYSWISTISVGLAPMGLAISPDSTRLYVANNGSNSVSVVRVADGVVLEPSVSVGTGPSGIAITPDGQSGYVANAGSGNLSQLGGGMTLTIAKTGSGIGTVTSAPSGINCGTVCQAKFSPLTSVAVTATAVSGSFFQSWTGDAGCGDGVVTMNTNKSCTAVFQAIPASGGGGGSGSGGNGGSGCFIATAAYGSDMADEVVTLRRFRDSYLLINTTGKELVQLYYQYSPPAADYLRQHDNLRSIVRWGLWPVVFAIKYPAAAFSTIFVFSFLVIRSRRSRTSAGARRISLRIHR